MLKRIIVDCLICSALVAGGKIISNVAEKNPKLKVVKDNVKKNRKRFFCKLQRSWKINFRCNEKRRSYSLWIANTIVFNKGYRHNLY